MRLGTLSFTFAGRARRGHALAAGAFLLLLPACGQKPANNVAQAADSTADAIANRADSVRRMAGDLTANVEGMPDNGAAAPGNQAADEAR